jgi:hypothetical protein
MFKKTWVEDIFTRLGLRISGLFFDDVWTL